MKIKKVISVIVLLLTSSLFCENINVDVNGTMDYASIQEAINAATNGDSIIVYPGIYNENLDLLGKSLSIVSTYIYSEIDTLIASTVIDGGGSNRCFYIEDSDNVHINGFTIQNGRDHTYEGGGGIYNENCSLHLSNCIIEHNRANSGGGIYNFESDLVLKNNIFRYNRGDYVGGAILHLSTLTQIIDFDEIEKNSIYLNYSANGSDLTILPHHEIETITLDTFTVLEPTQFYVAAPESISFNIEQAIITPIENDVYVSPNGSDENSGLSPADPFQTIAWAQMNIKSDSLNSYRIILDDGIYSPSLNNQLYPLNTHNYVGIYGSSRENTILDAEGLGNFIFYFTNYQKKYINLKDLTLENGGTPYHFSSCIDIKYVHADLNLVNCKVHNCSGDSWVIQASEGSHRFVDCVFTNNTNHMVIDITPSLVSEEPYINLDVIGCIFDDNPAYHDPDGFHSGGAIRFYGLYTGVGEYKCNIINSKFTRNRNIFFNNQYQGGTVGVLLSKYVEAKIINCTFADNTIQYPNGTCINVVDNTTLDIYNTIIYGNDYNTLTLWNDDCIINIYNSLLENGEDNIYYHENGTVNWYGDNLYDNPFFIESGVNEYHLLSNSPCIESGTMDLPDGIELPEYDLAGNPRIYGNSIDMGCYEWQGTDVSEDIADNSFKLSNFPNPFNPETTIEFSISEDTEILLSIYNIRGQLVKTLINSNIEKGQHRISWDGKNESVQSTSSGIYYCRLKSDNMETVRKMILMK